MSYSHLSKELKSFIQRDAIPLVLPVASDTNKKKSKRVLAAGLCTEEVSCSNSRRVARRFLDRFQRFGETSVNAGGRISTAINTQGLFPPNASFSGPGFVTLVSHLYFFKEKRENLFCELN
ncbi:hypothetical protein AVEN_217180-1 [Araneus ventricosus]|uniref:Uncharacterized protein n=1 Tax=Araneus ventricosus TaxID=182803 RepID=A0A4Y2SRA3_ARAVE|nr:hypothetical protein AVEN_217180-1 [Araneus ventricosus]